MAGIKDYTHTPTVDRSLDFDVVSDVGTLLQGAVYARWTALGLITSGANVGKYVISKTTATDGSQHIKAILAEPADSTASDVPCTFNRTGEWIDSAIVLDPSWTIATAKADLVASNISIFLTSAVRSA